MYILRVLKVSKRLEGALGRVTTNKYKRVDSTKHVSGSIGNTLKLEVASREDE